MESDQADCENGQSSQLVQDEGNDVDHEKLTINGVEGSCKLIEKNGHENEKKDCALAEKNASSDPEKRLKLDGLEELEGMDSSSDQAGLAATKEPNNVTENGLTEHSESTFNHDLSDEEIGDSNSPSSKALSGAIPVSSPTAEVSDAVNDVHSRPKSAMDDLNTETQKGRGTHEAPPPVSEVTEEKISVPKESVDDANPVPILENIEADAKLKTSTPIPTPVFEDITDDEDDSDPDTVGDNNIELELDDLIEPSELHAEPCTAEDKKLKKSSDDSTSDDVNLDSQDQEVHFSKKQNLLKTVISENVHDSSPNVSSENNFTLLKSSSETVKVFPKLKVTARKSGRPVSQSDSAPLKTINLHPIKDITMDVSEVEDALYLSKSSTSNADQCHEGKESSFTENSVSISDLKPFLGGRKKRRKKSYDLPGCRKRLKKIRSDAESIGSSADSMSLADSVSLSDGEFQEADSHKDIVGLTNDTAGARSEHSLQAPSSKVESALDILTKNSHLGFAKKSKPHSSSSSSNSSTLLPSSRKYLFPPSKLGSTTKKSGKIKSVLDMLHRRSQQRAESVTDSVVESGGVSTSESSSSVSTVSSIGSSSNSSSNSSSASLSSRQGAGTTTTTICVTSSESSTTTTIMVSPNRPVIEGMKRKGTPRKRKEEVICLSDSDDSDGKPKGGNEGKKKRDMTHDGSSATPSPLANLTSTSKGHSLLSKSRLLTSTVSGTPTPAPVVMVVAQHSTAAGMRSLLPQHALLQASGGLVMQGGKVVKPPPGSSLLPLISTLPLGAKAVNFANLPAGITAVPITSLASMAGSGGQQTVTLFGPISATGGAGAAVPLSGANIVNISGSKHLVYSAAPLQAQPGGRMLTPMKNSTSLLSSTTLPLPSSLSSPVVSQILLAGPKSSVLPNTKPAVAGGVNKALPSATGAASSGGNNLESLRALLVGKPVALSTVARSPFSSTASSSSSSTSTSLLSSTPMLFQMVTTSGNNFVPIPAQPLTLASVATPPQLKHLQPNQALLKSSASTLLSSSLLPSAVANNSSISSNSKSEVNSRSTSVSKSHAVPNGVLSCLTPPKTPDNDSSMEVAAAATLSRLVTNQAETSDIIPLCCCKVNGASFPKLTSGHTYCQALDTVDNKIMGCFNKVTNSILVRPGVKIPFMAMCEAHRRRLKLHQCCPGCGHFCVQGSFLQCKKEGKESVHTFHKQCVFYRGGKHLCPHCGEECGTTHIQLRREEGAQPGVAQVVVSPRLASKRDAVVRKVARISSRGVKKNKSTNRAKEENLALPNNKVIDISAIPLGPDQQILSKLSKCAIEDRPKKYRSMAKDLYTPASEGDVEKVFYLLMDQVDPNQRYEEQEDQTAMHAAATAGSIGTVVLLQQFGAEIHAQDKSLRTPMMCAAENGNLNVVKFLDKAGAKVEDRGEDGMTSLHYAAKAGHIDIVQYILSTERVDVNIEDDGGWTPIIWATESQLLDVVKFLIKHGGDPNKKDNEENTGLHWAAFSGSLDISEVFLDLGCELDSPNEHGDRPLHIAARQDHYDIVMLLLARGANVNLKNNKEETPVECCINQTSQVCMALKVNQKLRAFAANKLIQPERLVERDITMGREKNPIACVNSEDDEPCPTDFLYVTSNVETSWLNINSVITSLQSCRCKDDCSSMYCVCGRSSIRCWYDKMGRLIEEINLLEPPLVFECNRACWSPRLCLSVTAPVAASSTATTGSSRTASRVVSRCSEPTAEAGG
ncbi:hypothetical protein EGW08_022351 [Elysia chlorotica]|uniref:Pre-SET domain-containing protein n=1 Tax=Elysia chlorotica TaxID=188477 RepID=A0A433SL84_ELYCH|nr:hypothetical protein EGW08_022351 [Elysia chlorotica]